VLVLKIRGRDPGQGGFAGEAAIGAVSYTHLPGASGYFQASWLTHAKTWRDLEVARDHWGAPPLNLVFANAAGDVGWAPAGLTPIRPNWDGLTPVPGDGRYEWAGFLKGEDLPSSLNPAEGWLATANQMDLPAGYPAEQRKISFEWSDS